MASAGGAEQHGILEGARVPVHDTAMLLLLLLHAWRWLAIRPRYWTWFDSHLWRSGRTGSPSPQCACGGSACAAGRRRYRSWLLSVKVAVPCCIASIPRVGGLFTRAGADVGRAYVARLVASLRGRAVGRSAVLGSAALWLPCLILGTPLYRCWCCCCCCRRRSRAAVSLILLRAPSRTAFRWFVTGEWNKTVS